MSVDMNRTLAEASLDNLHDIIVPEPVGLFPLAPGWILLILLLLTLLFHFGWQRYLVYRKEQYRREALDELQALKEPGREHTLALLSLAKRTGISAYGRERVAILSDDDWWNFMQSESRANVPDALKEALVPFLYNDKDLESRSYQTLFAVVETWIKTHKGLTDV